MSKRPFKAHFLRCTLEHEERRTAPDLGFAPLTNAVDQRRSEQVLQVSQHVRTEAKTVMVVQCSSKRLRAWIQLQNSGPADCSGVSELQEPNGAVHAWRADGGQRTRSFFAIFSTMIGAVEIARLLPDRAMRRKSADSTREFLLQLLISANQGRPYQSIDPRTTMDPAVRIHGQCW